MRKRKWMVLPDDRWNIGLLESWLEDEAARGWLLVSGGTRLAEFERREPCRCRMRLEPVAGNWLPREQREELEETYRELGWECICELDDYRVSVCFDASAPELQTDPVAENWALERLLKRKWRETLLTWPILLALCGLAVWGLARREAPVEHLLETNSLPLLLGLALLPAALWDAVQSARGIYHLRRQLKAGLPRSHSGAWKRSQRMAAASFAVFLVVEACILIYPFWNIFTDWDAELDELPEPVPYLAGEVLDPSLAESLDAWDHCWWESSFLAPERYELWQSWRGGDWQARLDTNYDVVRFRFLAEALYEEKTAALRENWPADCLRELTDTGFDSGTLARTEGHTVLIARSGNAVLTVNAVGLEGVEAHLAEYAEVLGEFA